MNVRDTEALPGGGASADERDEIVLLMRKLKTENPEGYRIFLGLIRAVEKISPK